MQRSIADCLTNRLPRLEAIDRQYINFFMEPLEGQ